MSFDYVAGYNSLDSILGSKFITPKKRQINIDRNEIYIWYDNEEIWQRAKQKKAEIERAIANETGENFNTFINFMNKPYIQMRNGKKIYPEDFEEKSKTMNNKELAEWLGISVTNLPYYKKKLLKADNKTDNGDFETFNLLPLDPPKPEQKINLTVSKATYDLILKIKGKYLDIDTTLNKMAKEILGGIN